MAISNASARPMVTALFPDRNSADLAYGDITARGYGHDDVNVVMSEDTRNRQFAGTDHRPTELGSKAAEGAGIGGSVGASLGAIAAAIAAVGTSVVVPGLGLVIAGPLAAALAGAGAGAATGGLIGALIGWGLPEERVRVYEEGIKKGGIVVGVTPHSEEDARYFEGRFREHEGRHALGTDAGAAVGAVVGTCPDAVGGPLDTAAGAAVGRVADRSAGEVAAEVVVVKLEQVERRHNRERRAGATKQSLTRLPDKAWSATASTLAYVEDEPLKALLVAAAGGALLMGLVVFLARSFRD